MISADTIYLKHLGGFHPEQLVKPRAVATRQPAASHLPNPVKSHRERAHGMTAVFMVDPVRGLHEPRPPLAVDLKQHALLTLGVGHNVSEDTPALW